MLYDADPTFVEEITNGDIPLSRTMLSEAGGKNQICAGQAFTRGVQKSKDAIEIPEIRIDTYQLGASEGTAVN
jgi:hypothetical protein